MRIPWNRETKIFVLVFLAVILVIAILAFIIELIRRRRKQEVETVILTKEEKVVVPTRFITALSLNTDNVRKEYIVGDEFCADGLIVRAHYNLEPLVEEVTDYEIRLVDMNEVGTHVILISYADKNVGYEIEIKSGVEEIVEPVIIDEEDFDSLLSRYNRSFTSRLIQSDEEVKGWYTMLKNDLLSYKKVRDRISWKRESYRYGRVQFAKFAFRGKTLCLFLPLNAAEFEDTKYKVEDISEINAYAETPCMYRIKNPRRVKFAMELIALVAERLGIPRIEREAAEYYLPYEEDAPLIARGLIKYNGNDAGDISILEILRNRENEEVVGIVDDTDIITDSDDEEVIVEDTDIVTDSNDEAVMVEDTDIVIDSNDEVVIDEDTDDLTRALLSRYNYSFTARLIQSDDEIKAWYSTLKNDLLSYKKVRERMSWKRESYRVRRLQFAKFAFRGKTLCLFLPLNAAEFEDTKYKVEDISETNAYIETPCMYRIKNPRRVKFAMELIALVAERLGVERIEREEVDYYLPYENLDTLIAKGLVKINDGVVDDRIILSNNNLSNKDVTIVEPEVFDLETFGLGYKWIYEGKVLTTPEIVAVLNEKTTITSDDVIKAVKVVIKNMDKLGKTTCEVDEEDKTINFYICKGEDDFDIIEDSKDESVTDTTVVDVEPEDAVVTEEVVETTVTETSEGAVVSEEVVEMTEAETSEGVVVTEEVVETIVTETPEDAVVTEEVVETIVTETPEDAVVTDEVVETIVTETLKDEAVTEEVVETIVTETPEDAVVTEEVVDTIVTETPEDAVVTEEVVDTTEVETIDDAVVSDEVTEVVADPSEMEEKEEQIDVSAEEYVVDATNENTEEVVDIITMEEVVSETVTDTVDEVIVDVNGDSDDGYTWTFEENTLTTSEMIELLKEKTTLIEEDILKSVKVVIMHMDKLGKKNCELREDNVSVYFVIKK